MQIAANRFESWGFDAPPRGGRARSARVLEAVAQSVEVERDSTRSRALVVPVTAVPPRTAQSPVQAIATYRAMASFALCGLGRLIDDTA